MDQAMQDCINSCESCSDICKQTLQYCLETGGAHAEEEHIKLLEDCIRICDTSADFMKRESTNHGLTCGVCSDICAQCAEACEAFEDDEKMQECARACRECSESCLSMAQAA